MTATVFHTNKIDVLVLGRRFRFPDIRDFRLAHYKAMRYRDALLLQLDEGEIWLFDYGALVCWGVNENDKQALLNTLYDYIEETLPQRESEHYTFALLADGATRIHNDELTLSDNNPLQRLATSHAFAQSVKLGVFETLAHKVIEDNSYLAKMLARTGKIPLSRRKLAQLRGLLFTTSSDILLNFNLLDTPDFFWDYPELEADYLAVAKYLELVPRINLLNQKLATIHELVDMLASEQNHKHSSFLEWIIIILIAVEIILSFVH
jgi:uncharacterized Rmd1/YagE family protein